MLFGLLHVVASNFDEDYVQLLDVPPLGCSGRFGIHANFHPNSAITYMLWRRFSAWQAFTLEAAGYPCAIRCCRMS